MRVIIINGPNLNLLGTRETNIYGKDSFESFFKVLENTNNHIVKLEYYQSNVEGEIINKIHEITFEKGEKYDGIKRRIKTLLFFIQKLYRFNQWLCLKKL